uniref:Chromo domain-containing protein n=1 Tax=Oryza meridionalis TaxID=40149 RepID=A0A0E0DVE3_9ORYZ
MPRKKASSPSPTSTARETRSSSARGHASPTPTPTLRRSTRETTSRFSSSSSSSANKLKGSPAKQSANNNTAKRKMNNAAADTSTRPIKKNKRLNAKSYLALFSTPQQTAKSPPAPAPPLGVQVDDDNASTVPMQDSGTLLEHEEADTQEQGYQSGLHKVPEVVLEETDVSKNKADEHASTSEPLIPVDLCSNDNASESSHGMEVKEQTAKKTIEAGDPREIKGASTSNQALVTHSDGTDYNEYLCAVCRSRETPGILKSCDGKDCKNRYHDSCLDPPLQYVSLVSEGIESLWDVKEGVQNNKQYFVKYKNLAHVHNQWLPESDIIRTPGGQDLINKFCKRIQKEKTIRWKQEWAEPHRLLKKRPLMSEKEAEEFFNSLGDKFAYCNVEWLVKWKDLGYEYATWELETSSFLCTPEAKDLKRNYESRHEDARRGFDPAKINKGQGS